MLKLHVLLQNSLTDSSGEVCEVDLSDVLINFLCMTVGLTILLGVSDWYNYAAHFSTNSKSVKFCLNSA